MSEIDSQKINQLKTAIRNIAKEQADNFNNSGNVNFACTVNIDEIKNNFGTLSWPSDVDSVKVKANLEELDLSLKSALDEDQVLEGFDVRVPYTADVLKLIFVSTNEKTRQEYFHNLAHYYYDELSKYLTTRSVSNYIFDLQVKYLIPFVKLQIAIDQAATNQKDDELFRDIFNFFQNIRINQEDIYQVVTNYIGSKEYDLQSYEMIPVGEANGHLGEYFKLKIYVTRQNKAQQINLFAKFLTPYLPGMREYVKSGPAKKEEFFYRTFVEQLKEHGFEQLLDFMPKCYFSRLNDVLILDDLTELDFQCLSNSTTLEVDSLKTGMKTLAKFHSCSMVLEDYLSKKQGRDVTLQEMYGEYLKEVLVLPDDINFKRVFDSSVEDIAYMCSLFPEISSKYSHEQLLEKAKNGWKLAAEKVKASSNLKNVICHGDLYVANMLFRFNKETICDDTKLIDFQLLRYCPPTNDILFFLYQNAAKTTIDQYKSEILDEYYDELSKCLKTNGLDPQTFYSKLEFNKSVKYMHSESVMRALFYHPLQKLDPKIRMKIFHDAKEMEKLYSEKFYTINIGMEDKDYRQSIKDVVSYFIDLCDKNEI